MSVIEKLILKFKRKPTKLKFKDVEKILIFIGFEKIQAKGSHVKYKRQGVDFDIIVPIHNNDCKDFYKEQIQKIIKKIL